MSSKLELRPTPDYINEDGDVLPYSDDPSGSEACGAGERFGHVPYMDIRDHLVGSVTETGPEDHSPWRPPTPEQQYIIDTQGLAAAREALRGSLRGESKGE